MASTAEAITAIATLIIALCFIVCVAYLYFIFRAVTELGRQVKELSELIKASALSTMDEVKSSAHAVRRLSGVLVNIARPIATAALLRGAPAWLRTIGVLAESATAARRAFDAVTTARSESPRSGGKSSRDTGAN